MPHGRAEVIQYWAPGVSRSAGQVQRADAGLSRPVAPSLSPQAGCEQRSCRIQVMMGRFWIATSRHVALILTCRILSFDFIVRRKRLPLRPASKIHPQAREGRPSMKYLFAAVMLASAVVGFSEAASAAGGCGPGWYRGPYGGCRPMAARRSSRRRRARRTGRGGAPPRVPLRLPLVRRTLPPVLISCIFETAAPRHWLARPFCSRRVAQTKRGSQSRSPFMFRSTATSAASGGDASFFLPVTVMPTPVTMMPMAMPVHLLRLHAGDFLAAGDRRTDIGVRVRHVGRTVDRLR